MTKLSIIVPTCGRYTLNDTLLSIQKQLSDVDEVIIVGDGHQPNAVDILFLYDDDIRFRYIQTPSTNCWGNTQRNLGASLARGSHIAFIDDDDCYAPNALDHFRDFACDKPVIFRMEYKGHYLLWKYEGLLECGNMGTPCYLVPRVDPMPKFGQHYAGDFDFIRDAVQQIGEPVWRPEIVANIRPHETT